MLIDLQLFHELFNLMEKADHHKERKIFISIVRENKLDCCSRRRSVILRFAHWVHAKIFGTSRCESRKQFQEASPHVQTRDAFRNDILEVNSTRYQLFRRKDH